MKDNTKNSQLTLRDIPVGQVFRFEDPTGLHRLPTGVACQRLEGSDRDYGPPEKLCFTALMGPTAGVVLWAPGDIAVSLCVNASLHGVWVSHSTEDL